MVTQVWSHKWQGHCIYLQKTPPPRYKQVERALLKIDHVGECLFKNYLHNTSQSSQKSRDTPHHKCQHHKDPLSPVDSGDACRSTAVPGGQCLPQGPRATCSGDSWRHRAWKGALGCRGPEAGEAGRRRQVPAENNVGEHPTATALPCLPVLLRPAGRHEQTSTDAPGAGRGSPPTECACVCARAGGSHPRPIPPGRVGTREEKAESLLRAQSSLHKAGSKTF